jgi:Protein of unknown function (DUF1579)
VYSCGSVLFHKTLETLEEKSMKRTVIAVGLIALLFAVATQAQAPVPKPGPEQKKLDVWVGDWTYVVDSKASPLGPAGKATGKSSFSMILGGFAQEGRYSEKGTNGSVEGHQVFAYDPINKYFTWNSWENTGDIISGSGTVSGNTWNWKGTGILGGKKYAVRGTDVLSQDLKTDKYTFEVSTDEKTWIPVFEVKLTKTK